MNINFIYKGQLTKSSNEPEEKYSFALLWNILSHLNYIDYSSATYLGKAFLVL